MKLAPERSKHKEFESVSELDCRFLALFPHRFDYLRAAHPDPGERPNWQTERRYPLSDRRLQQGTYLYGVRFGKLTRYCVLDVDKGSAYHPTRDPFAIQRLVAALEVIGLVAHVVVTSSYSGGLHLYFPFEQEQQSWEIALVVSTLLEQAGFKLKPGQLEVFPNPRPYTDGPLSLYNGHRVPLQAGSYLLNDHWEQVYSDQAAFVQQWQWAEQRNDLDPKTVKRVLKQAKRQRSKVVTVSAQKFLNDLDTEIERGWTGRGQTQKLLGRIALREYIFGYVLRGGAPLTGQALVDAIVEIAVALPGYTEWCRHQHEIAKKAAEWARAAEASPKYYPYDPSKRRETALQKELQPQNNIVSFNQKSALEAEQRIKNAIATLRASGNFPTGTTARADAIVLLARCSKQTLNKHKPLWHPDHNDTETEPITASGASLLVTPLEPVEPLPEGSVHPIHPNKFVANPAAPSEQAEQHQAVGGSGGISTGQALPAVFAVPGSNNAALNPEITTTEGNFLATEGASVPLPETLATEEALRPGGESNPASSSAATSLVSGAAAAIAQWVTEKRERQAQAKAAQRQAWLTSGDPILVKEAEAWFAAQAERTRLQLAVEETDPGG